MVGYSSGTGTAIRKFEYGAFAEFVCLETKFRGRKLDLNLFFSLSFKLCIIFGEFFVINKISGESRSRALAIEDTNFSKSYYIFFIIFLSFLVLF